MFSKKFLIVLFLFLFLIACTQETKKQKEPVLQSVILEKGDYLFFNGAKQFEGEKLKLRIDDFKQSENILESGKVKITLLLGNKIIDSKYFKEMDTIENVFPILEPVYVSKIHINEYRKDIYVLLEFVTYE